MAKDYVSILSQSTASSRSPLSSRSSTRSIRSIESFVKSDNKQISEEVLKEIQEDILSKTNESLQKYFEKILSTIKDENDENILKVCQSTHQNNLTSILETEAKIVKKSLITDQFDGKFISKQRENLIETLQNEHCDSHINVANDNAEEMLNDLENELNEEMTSRLQELYRFHRNITLKLNINKTTSVEIQEDLLETKLIQALNQINTKVNELSQEGKSHFINMIDAKEARFRKKIEREMRTLNRELDKLTLAAENKKLEERSKTCVIM